jgi:hypothetical protein
MRGAQSSCSCVRNAIANPSYSPRYRAATWSLSARCHKAEMSRCLSLLDALSGRTVLKLCNPSCNVVDRSAECNIPLSRRGVCETDIHVCCIRIVTKCTTRTCRPYVGAALAAYSNARHRVRRL